MAPIRVVREEGLGAEASMALVVVGSTVRFQGFVPFYI